MKRWIPILVLSTACGGLDNADKDGTSKSGWQVVDSTPHVSGSNNAYPGNNEPTPTVPVQVDPMPVPSLIAVPAATGECVGTSLIDATLPSAAPADGASITETFDVNGCVGELWVTAKDAAGAHLQGYIPWSPPPSYMIPMPWMEVTTHNGRVTKRDRHDPWTKATIVVETTTRDAAENILEVATQGSEWAPPGDQALTTRLVKYHPVSLLQVLDEQTYDNTVAWRTRVETDANGKPLKAFQFDGTAEKQTSEWRYRTDGRLEQIRTWEPYQNTTATYTWANDGSYRVRTLTHDLGWIDENHYDAQGRLLKHTQDSDANGRIDYIRELSYDALGHTVREFVAYDFASDGTARGDEITRGYDGDRLLWELQSWRTGNGQTWTRRMDVTYTANGSTASTLTRYADGQVMREVSVLDALGQETLRTQDTGDDGSIEWKTTRVFDDTRILSEVTTSANYNSKREVVWDAQGRMLLDITDGDSDGRADYGTRYRYDVDAIDAFLTLDPPQLF